jgi:hypothetical protein
MGIFTHHDTGVQTTGRIAIRLPGKNMRQKTSGFFRWIGLSSLLVRASFSTVGRVKTS